ncbi:hypothetical protein LBMAG49_01470 [Planctomycetota bacterium]|nr:hypothetical protein LBMAG49_01470 [Planctomycetota bacterium]
MTRTQSDLQATAIVQFAHALVTAAQDYDLNGRDSTHVLVSLHALIRMLRTADTHGCELPLQLQFSDDWIHHDGKPLVAPSLQAAGLLRDLAARDVAALAFDSELKAEEALRLFDLLLLPQNVEALHRSHREQALQAFGIRNVRLTSRTPADPSDRSASVIEAIDDLHHYQNLAASLQHNHARAHRDQMLAVDQASTAVERVLLRLDTEPSGLLSLAAQDNVDRFTVGHSVRVALLALQVARAAGADRDQLVLVGTAALLHDIGKSKVPQEILFKEGKLDESEWQWMAQHPRLGAHILMEQQDLDPSAIGAAFCHHMQADGAGYPQAAVPVMPSGTSKLVRVCDAFEALTAVRPYKRALAPAEAFAVMHRNPCDFDQRWLRLFVRTLGIFPVGTRVQLDSGALATVIGQTSRIDLPIVRMLTGAGGSEMPLGVPDQITIGTPHAGETRHIHSVQLHDRHVPLPPIEAPLPEVLSQTTHGACLRLDTAPERKD